jgi:ferredoxin
MIFAQITKFVWEERIMARKVIIDEEACSGCGTCAAIAEDCFALDEEAEKAHVIDESACTEEQIQEAIDTCPEEAIKWAD